MRSYKELPVRYAESSTLHRDERGGTLHGLLRVKHITQDDAHIFCTEDQIQDEIDQMIEYAKYLYDLFGVVPRAELSTRPDNRLGTEEQWDVAEGALETALKRHGMDFVIGEGEGTFYGPKIDLHMSDSLGRSWQMGTIQLDYQMPMRFGLDLRRRGQHRASSGRHSPGAPRLARALRRHPDRAPRRRVPVWLSPVQVRVLPVSDTHREDARALAAKLREAGVRVEVDDSDETVGKRIRNAEVEKIPFAVVYGDRESEESLAIRERGGEQFTASLGEFLSKLARL